MKAAPIDTWSEAWRHECEAQYVASKPTRAERAEYLDAISKKRGTAAGNQLRASVARIWSERQAAKPRTPASGEGGGCSVLRRQSVASPASGPSWSVRSAGDSNRSMPLGDGRGA
ncbi:hypothetical protein LNV47_22650 [Paucibacter sp. DJ4R-1]|nr:hypothetical protein [Paucibacter sp. DJ4R-1]